MSCGRVIISGVGPGPVSMTLHDPDDSHGIYDRREPGLPVQAIVSISRDYNAIFTSTFVIPR